MTRSPRFLVLTLALLLSFSVSVAQDGRDTQNDVRALRSWIALDAPPGWEHLATDVILKSLPGWRRDALGNLILRKGSGSPRRVIACGLDRPGFAVTEITEDGYLRLREVGSLRMHALWTQFHEGQRSRVLTRNGSVAGVVTVKSTHLQRGRVANAPVTTLDDLWVDVGATSRADVWRLGIEMLNPVVRDTVGWSCGDFVAGPLAGVRVGCAAVASAAAGEVQNGETIFLITTLRSFGNDGLEAALRALGRVDQVTGMGEAHLTPDTIIAVEKNVEKANYLPESTGLSSVDVLAVKRRYEGSLVESVRVTDANVLLMVVAQAAGVAGGLTRWLALPEITRSKPNGARDTGSTLMGSRTTTGLPSTAELLKLLADVPAVSGHERPVREAIVRT